MTDETQSTTPATTQRQRRSRAPSSWPRSADETGVQAEAVIVTDFTHTLIVAAFADQDSAMETYQALRDAEVSHGLHIDAVAVVTADAEGKIHAQKVTEHSTKKGLKWGVGAGIVLAVIFPPSLLAGAVAGGVAGSAIGKIRHTTPHHRAREGAPRLAAAGQLGHRRAHRDGRRGQASRRRCPRPPR